MNELLGHPGIGASWESYCLENIMAHFTDWQAYFYRTSSGNEIDLILEKGNEKMAIEFKASTSPRVSKGLNNSLDELGIDKAWVIAQVEGSYPLSTRIMVSSLEGFISTTP
jgi:predicted AAA+ superfamily ATPase